MPLGNKAGDSDETPISRRRLLALGAGAAATGLAGCSGGDGDGDGAGDGTPTPTGTATDEVLVAVDNETATTASTQTATEEPTEPKGEMVDDTITITTTKLPNRSNFNWFTEKNKRWLEANLLFQRPTKNLINGDIRKVIVDDWSLSDDGTTFTVHIDEDAGWKWHNGKELTAEDFTVLEKVELAHDPPEERDTPMEEITGLIEAEVADKYTAKFHYGAPQNELLLAYGLDNWGTYRPRWIYGPWVDKFDDATSQKKRDEVMSNLTETTWGFDDIPGTGPYKVTNFSTTSIDLELWDEHPLIDQVNVPNIKVRVAKEQAAEQMTKQGEIDMGDTPLSPTLQKSVPDQVMNISEFRQPRIEKLMFHRTNEHLDRQGVRRAICYALDYENIVKNKGGIQFEPGKPTGMSTPMDNAILGDTVDKYIDYGLKAKPDKAAEAMRSAGYTKEDGNWVGPNGNVPNFTFPSPTWGPWVKAGKTISQQLKSFGLGVDFLTKESSAWFNDVFSWKFDLVVMWNGSHSMVSHPAVNYQNSWIGTLVVGGDPEAERAANSAAPVSPTIPSEIGSMEVGDGKEINLVNLCAELSTNISRERMTEIVADISWWWNYDAHAAELMDNGAGMMGHRGHFNFPEENAPITKTKMMAVNAAHIGEVQPMYE